MSKEKEEVEKYEYATGNHFHGYRDDRELCEREKRRMVIGIRRASGCSKGFGWRWRERHAGGEGQRYEEFPSNGKNELARRVLNICHEEMMRWRGYRVRIKGG